MMKRELRFTEEAESNLEEITKGGGKKGLHSQVLKTLGYLEVNLKHPSLCTHEYCSLEGENGEKVWEAYVQNRTPGAYRVFFHYGPDRIVGKKRVPVITVIAITPHP